MKIIGLHYFSFYPDYALNIHDESKSPIKDKLLRLKQVNYLGIIEPDGAWEWEIRKSCEALSFDGTSL